MKKLFLLFLLFLILDGVYAGKITAFATFDIKKPIDIKTYKDKEYNILKRNFNLNDYVYVLVEINGEDIKEFKLKLNNEDVNFTVKNNIYYFDFKILDDKDYKISVNAIINDKKLNTEKIIFVNKANKITGAVVAKQIKFNLGIFFRDIFNKLFWFL